MQRAVRDVSMRIVTAAAGGASACVPGIAWGEYPPGAGEYGYGPHMMWGYGMIFGPLFMILVLVVVIASAVLLVRWIGLPYREAPPDRAPPARTPLDILRERFARGEIDKDEFEERRRVLGE